VVVGENPGPSKIDKIGALGVKTLDEDQFFSLIKCKSLEDEDTKKKTSSPVKQVSPAKPKKIVKEDALVMPMLKGIEDQMWTDKYAPMSPVELIGNHSIFEKLTGWLSSWKMAGKGDPAAVLMSGPPGIGKTTMARLACQQEDFDVIEMNASDTRSKKLLHVRYHKEIALFIY
jgi:replication factor C subunit 1